MFEAADLQRLLGRTTTLAALRALAVAAGSQLEVRTDPAALGDESAGAPVAVFGSVVGRVAARGGCAEDTVAERCARVLAELCGREYEVVDLAREVASSYEELNLFYELSAALAGTRDPALVCDTVLGAAHRVMPCAAARIVLLEGGIDSGPLLRRIAARGADVGDERVDTAASVAADVVARGQAVVTDAAGGDTWERRAARSLLAVPLRLLDAGRTGTLGVLELRDRRADDGGVASFSAGDAKLAQALADQAALLLENARLVAFERELRLARDIQQSLLPAQAPEMQGLDVAGTCVPASDVGGDYYDFLRSGQHGLVVLLADVSGHHLAAALHQTAARATFRAAAVAGKGAAAMLETVNAALFDDLARSDHYLTAFLARADARDGCVVWESAGHPPALLYRADSGSVERLAGQGLPVGVLRDGGFVDHVVDLRAGDVLLLYTDGLTEALGEGGEFGEARLAEALRAAAGGRAAEIAAAALDAVRAHAPASEDDRTVVVLKRVGPEDR